jgi:tetratricopeptide (TPR) repeat protein
MENSQRLHASSMKEISPGASNASVAGDIVEMVVVTTDEVFLRTLRKALSGARRLWHVATADKVSDLLIAGQVGILVLDVMALHEPAGGFLSQIKRQFPDLVIIVAGKRKAEVSLGLLISSGAVYRFIHKPMSPARAKLFADAAVKKYSEQRLRFMGDPVTATAAPRHRHLWFGAAGIALTLLGVAGWALMRWPHAARSTPVADAPDPAAGESPLLKRAAAALAANRLTQPSGDNALQLYQRMLAQNPADPAARAGLAEVRERLATRANNALLEERLEDAGAAIDAARRAGVDSGRIAFLSAQLTQARGRRKGAIAELRKADARAPAADDAGPRTPTAEPAAAPSPE